MKVICQVFKATYAPIGAIEIPAANISPLFEYTPKPLAEFTNWLFGGNDTLSLTAFQKTDLLTPPAANSVRTYTANSMTLATSVSGSRNGLSSPFNDAMVQTQMAAVRVPTDSKAGIMGWVTGTLPGQMARFDPAGIRITSKNAASGATGWTVPWSTAGVAPGADALITLTSAPDPLEALNHIYQLFINDKLVDTRSLPRSVRTSGAALVGPGNVAYVDATWDGPLMFYGYWYAPVTLSPAQMPDVYTRVSKLLESRGIFI